MGQSRFGEFFERTERATGGTEERNCVSRATHSIIAVAPPQNSYSDAYAYLGQLLRLPIGNYVNTYK